MFKEGALIEAKRKRQGLSASGLAKLLKTNKDNIYKWQKGTRPSDPEDYRRLMSWLEDKLEIVPHETELHLERMRKIKKSSEKNSIPFYDAQAVAGITETEMTPIHAPSGTIDIGDLLRDSQAAIRIYGNSMLPNYPPGCVVGLYKCVDSFIEPGEVYVIETRDRRMLKRLFFKDDDTNSDYFVCYSDNIMKFEGGARDGKLAYPPFELPKSEIVNLFIVTGVIKRNSNSVIINR